MQKSWDEKLVRLANEANKGVNYFVVDGDET